MAWTMLFLIYKTKAFLFTLFATGITGSITRLCGDEDTAKILVATLGDTLKFSLCIEAEITSSNYPVVQYRKLWILVNRTDDKFEFSVDRKQSTETSHVILFTVYSVTVEDYGVSELKILTQPNQGLDFNFYIQPPGTHETVFKVERLLDNVSESVLVCYSSWYPRSVSIKKKWSATLPKIRHNIWNISERVSLDLLIESCKEAGLYQCNITDFDGFVTTKELQVNFDNCPPRLCDWQSNDLTLVAEVNDSMQASICLFATENFDIHPWLMDANNTTASPNFIVSHTKPTAGEHYHYINITVEHVRAVDHGEYTLMIIASSKDLFVNNNVKFNLKSKYSTDFCNGTVNNTTVLANIGQTKTIYFCIQAVEGLRDLIEINKSPYTIVNNTIQSVKYGLRVDQAEKGKYLFALDILNVKSNAALNYTVKMQSNLGLDLIYRFSLRLKNGSLKLCNKENDIVTARLHTTAVIHICVTTDAGIGSHLALDNINDDISNNTVTLLRVNGSSRRDKYAASAYPRSDNATTDYFIQVFIRNVTWRDLRKYRITIKPILNHELKYEFVLESQIDTAPRFCDSEFPKLYYFSSVGEHFHLRVCVRTDDAIDEHVWINDQAYPRKHYSDHVLTGHKRLGNPKRHLLTFTFSNITDDNFTRYDVRLHFHSTDEFIFTFYLLDNKVSPALPCLGCTTAREVYSPIGGRVYFCFITYGAMDEDIIINSRKYPIDVRHESAKFGLESQWSETRRINYIKIEVNDVHKRDFKQYDIRLASIDKQYTFVLHQVTVKGETLQLICTAETSAQYVSITDEDGRYLAQSSSHAVAYIARLQCESSWSYVCKARGSQNVTAISKWIHLAIEECPPRFCYNETHVRTLSAQVGNTSVISVCIIAYVHDVSLYWDGDKLSPSLGKHHYHYRKEEGNSVKHMFEIAIVNITSSDFGAHILDIKLGRNKDLDLKVFITKAVVSEQQESTPNNGSMYIIIAISATVTAVLTLLALSLVFVRKVKLCSIHFKFSKTSENVCLHDNKPATEGISVYEEIVDIKETKKKTPKTSKRHTINDIYKPKKHFHPVGIHAAPPDRKRVPSR